MPVCRRSAPPVRRRSSSPVIVCAPPTVAPPLPVTVNVTDAPGTLTLENHDAELRLLRCDETDCRHRDYKEEGSKSLPAWRVASRAIVNR